MVLRQGGTLAESEGEFESVRDVDRRCFPADGNRPHSEWNRERERLFLPVQTMMGLYYPAVLPVSSFLS